MISWMKKNKKAPPFSRQQGQVAEDAACHFLLTQGLKLVDKNFTSKTGEIDLVMQDGHVIVFVEVRFRRHQNFGGALSSVTPAKQYKIIKTAALYLMSKKMSHQLARFDVVAFERELTQMKWIKDAFGLNGW